MKNVFSISDNEIVFTSNNEIDPVYAREIINRTKQIRLEAGFNDVREFAKLLKIKPEYYIDYEDFTPIPQYLIPDFCRLTKINPWQLLTGQLIPDDLK